MSPRSLAQRSLAQRSLAQRSLAQRSLDQHPSQHPDVLAGPVSRRDLRPASWLARLSLHPLVRAPALAGLVGSLLIALSGGRAAQVLGQQRTSFWAASGGVSLGEPRAWVPLTLLGGLILLTLSWARLLVLVRGARRGALTPRVLLPVGLSWVTPLLCVPPILSLDAYAYLAQGQVANSGLDPYVFAPAALLGGPWLQAMDPFWASSVTPYGPLGVALSRLAALAPSPLQGVIVLALLALLSWIATWWALARMPGLAHRGELLVLVALSPLVLIHVLGARHWEGVILALLALGALAWRSDHPLWGIALWSAAGAVKLPLLLVALVAVEEYWRRGRTPGTLALRPLGRALTGLALPWVVLSPLLPRPWELLAALSTPLTGRTFYAPSTLLAELLASLCHLAGAQVSFDRLLGGVRLLCVLAGFGVMVHFWLQRRTHSLERTLACLLGVLVVASPVVYPWYFAWMLVPAVLAASGTTLPPAGVIPTPRSEGSRLSQLTPWIAAGVSVAALPGFTALQPWWVRALAHAALTSSLLALLVAAFATAGYVWLRARERALSPGTRG